MTPFPPRFPAGFPPGIAAAGVRRRVRALLAPGSVLVLAVAASAYIGHVDPAEPGHYPTCPFLLVTGYYCPGCGMLRAVHALLHGDVGEALSLNALVVAMLPVLAYLWAWRVVTAGRGRPRPAPAPAAAAWGFLAIIAIFWIVRNLPFGRVLAP